VRITQRMVLDRSLASIRTGRSDMATMERQISTGRRFDAVSGDAVAGRRVLEIDSELARFDQIDRNIATARTRLGLEDAALQSVSGVLSRARELGLAQASAPNNADTRRAAALEVRELKAALIQEANQTIGGSYVFGGWFADRPPLDSTGALDPIAPARGGARYEIGAGEVIAAAHDAAQVFVDSDVMGALDALEAALLGDDDAGIDTAADRARAALTRVQDLVAEVGSRQLRLDVAEDVNQTLRDTLRTRRSELVDVPIEEAITRLVTIQASFQASLLATNRILDTTLVNYLR